MSTRTDTPFGLYAVMAVLTLTEALSSLEHTMIFAALPSISREHGLISMGWLVTIFLLVQASTAVIGARLGDIYGRRRLLSIIVAICLVGSLISGFSSDFRMIILGRALQGASGAILPLCYSLAKQTSPPKSAPFWIGVLTGGYTIASAAGYFLGGYLSDNGSWRDIFILCACYAACLLVLIRIVLPGDTVARQVDRLDLLGGILFVPGIVAILYGLTLGSNLGWTSPATIGLIVTGIAILAMWAWYEWRIEQPLINVRLFREPKILLGNVIGALASLGMMQLPLIFMNLLQQPDATGVGFGLSATLAGLFKVPSNLLSFGAAILAGYICVRKGGATGLLWGGLLAIVCWSLLIFGLHDLWITVLCMIGCSLASTIVLASLPNLLLEVAPDDRLSEVAGLSSTIRGIFSAVGSQIVILMLASTQIGGPSGKSYPTEAAYLQTITYVIIGSIILTSVAFLLARNKVAGNATT